VVGHQSHPQAVQGFAPLLQEYVYAVLYLGHLWSTSIISYSPVAPVSHVVVGSGSSGTGNHKGFGVFAIYTSECSRL